MYRPRLNVFSSSNKCLNTIPVTCMRGNRVIVLHSAHKMRDFFLKICFVKWWTRNNQLQHRHISIHFSCSDVSLLTLPYLFTCSHVVLCWLCGLNWTCAVPFSPASVPPLPIHVTIVQVKLHYSQLIQHVFRHLLAFLKFWFKLLKQCSKELLCISTCVSLKYREFSLDHPQQ